MSEHTADKDTPAEDAVRALAHSQYHGGGVDECSTDPASPCVALGYVTPSAETEAAWVDGPTFAEVFADDMARITPSEVGQA